MLRQEWLAPICDGLQLAGYPALGEADLECVFYGELFRPPGKANVDPPLDAADVATEWEQAVLAGGGRSGACRCERGQPGRGVEGAHADARPARARCPEQLPLLRGRRGERARLRPQAGLSLSPQPAIRRTIRERACAAIGADTRVVIGHSLGTVVAYEALCALGGERRVRFVSLGSPLGIRNLIFDRLEPAPAAGKGSWPSGINAWVNVADRGDVVALVKALAPCFGSGVRDVAIDNGARAHDATRYLNARETGDAIGAGLTREPSPAGRGRHAALRWRPRGRAGPGTGRDRARPAQLRGARLHALSRRCEHRSRRTAVRRGDPQLRRQHGGERRPGGPVLHRARCAGRGPLLSPDARLGRGDARPHRDRRGGPGATAGQGLARRPGAGDPRRLLFRRGERRADADRERHRARAGAGPGALRHRVGAAQGRGHAGRFLRGARGVPRQQRAAPGRRPAAVPRPRRRDAGHRRLPEGAASDRGRTWASALVHGRCQLFPNLHYPPAAGESCNRTRTRGTSPGARARSTA